MVQASIFMGFSFGTKNTPLRLITEPYLTLCISSQLKAHSCFPFRVNEIPVWSMWIMLCFIRHQPHHGHAMAAISITASNTAVFQSPRCNKSYKRNIVTGPINALISMQSYFSLLY